MPPDNAGTERAAEDRALLARVAQREPGAMVDLYDRYSGMLMGLASRVLGSSSDAEEVLQEAFLQVWNQAPRYDPGRSSVSTWLVLIVRSRAIDRLRSRRVVQKTVSAAQKEQPRSHTSPDGDRDVLTRERRNRLRSELDKLPEAQREVLELAFYRGLTQSEIAERTGIPLGTVKTRTLLAVRKLRKALQSELEELL